DQQMDRIPNSPRRHQQRLRFSAPLTTHHSPLTTHHSNADTFMTCVTNEPQRKRVFSMSQIAKTDRQRREVEFYRAYAAHQRVESIDFAPVEGVERRPWNPYWYVYEVVRSRFVSSSQRLLDFGCGIGIAALRFAHLGYQVDAFDLSDDNLQVGRDLAQRYTLDQRCRFTQAAAEDLPYDDDT